MTPRQNLLQQIEVAARQASRDPKDIKLIAVSKLQDEGKIRGLFAEGQLDFAENYPQEFEQKQKLLLALNLRWHFIGHLQKNKLKLVVGRSLLIHSVDSVELAQKISDKAQALGVRQDCLWQVNLAGESTKGGLDAGASLRRWPELADLPGLQWKGLMTMPPLQNDAEENREHFRRLKELQHKLKSLDTHSPLDELSMGTSHDFAVAIQEGATLIRVGTLLFGERKKPTASS